MAFDGFAVAAVVQELKDTIIDCHISKLIQPEKDELLLTIKGKCGQKRLLISAGASLPLIYLTENNKQAPLTAPAFCMLLRKFIANGKIIDITQPSLERIVCFHIEHLDELGDVRQKKLYVELMGKHSNIIFCDENDKIIDSIKHIPASVSSIREVLPGREYFIPNTMDKKDPLEVEFDDFLASLEACPKNIADAICSSFTGFSKAMTGEICYILGIDDKTAKDLNESEVNSLYDLFIEYVNRKKVGSFDPVMIIKGKEPVEFSPFELKSYMDGVHTCVQYDSMSALLESFYSTKNAYTRMRQKSAELRHIVSSAIERDAKKLDLQLKQLKDTEKRDKYKLYGELLLAYSYMIEAGAKSATVANYYEDNKDITIPLDETISATDNAKKYYDRYNKLKRTYEALSTLTVSTSQELEYLQSVATNLDIAVSEDDLAQIRDELQETGFIKKSFGNKKKKSKSKPFHYVTEDGFHIFVGKNNLQNEELTFKVANGSDWWFHAKKQPGSHVIIKSNGTEPSDSAFEAAAAAAAYYCKGSDASKVEIDYVQRREVKKVAGAAIGYVIYHTNYSMTIEPDISKLTEVFD